MRLLRHWKRPVAAAALASIGILGVAATDASAAPRQQPASQPVCTTPLVLHSIELVRTVDGPAILVKGIKPYQNTRVVLVAEDVVYVQQPDYWNYFIQGCGGSGLIAKVPFTQVLPINGPRGRYGIAIGGRTFDLGTGEAGPATS